MIKLSPATDEGLPMTQSGPCRELPQQPLVPICGAGGHAEPPRSSRGQEGVAYSLSVSWGARKPIFFTEGFDLGFGLLLCLVDVLADLRNIIARRLDVDDEALPIGCANNPPIRKGRISEGEQKNGYQ